MNSLPESLSKPASFIGGKKREGTDDCFELHDPATGVVIASAALANAQLVDDAVSNARRAVDGHWRAFRPADRERVLLKLAELIEREAEMLADIETLNNGMLRGFAQTVSVGASIEYLRYMAGWATKIEGSTLDLSIPHTPNESIFGYTLRRPIGVVGAIIPWNVPLLMAVWKLAPALAAGCTIVLKPSELTPLSAIHVAELALEAGIPEGVVNIVVGTGADAGAALSAHQGVDKLAFTGSTQTGIAIARQAAERVARVSLELGGKSPAIVMDDVDIEPTAAAIAQAILMNAGQICTAASRVLVHRTLFDRFNAALADSFRTMRLGSGFDGATTVGPLVSAQHATKVEGYVAAAERAGAQVLRGAAKPDQGYFVRPALVIGAPPDSPAVREEIFGPVICSLPFDDVDDALRQANGSDYALGASVWSNRLDVVAKIARDVRAGIVWANTHNFIDPNLAFGGMGRSGLGREMGRAAIEGFTELKSVCQVSRIP